MTTGYYGKSTQNRDKEEEVPDSGRILAQYGSGQEVCHQEDTALGRAGAEAEAGEEEKPNLRWPSHSSSSQATGDIRLPLWSKAYFKPILEVELARLMDLGELRVSDEVALKLKRMSSATINRKLRHQKEALHLLRSKGGPKLGSLLKRECLHQSDPVACWSGQSYGIGFSLTS